MNRSLSGVAVVLLPGTGSDAEFVVDAFGAAVSRVGARLIAVEPNPRDLIGGYRGALDRALQTEDALVVGGISIGAAVATQWASHHAAPGRADRPREASSRLVAVLAAMPAWTGSPRGSAAAVSARFAAAQLRRVGLDATVSAMQASSPPWLATTLTRSWRGQWPDLAGAMETAATHRGPDLADLRASTVPFAIAAALDDPVHPLAVAEEWHAAAPRSELRTFPLDAMARGLSELGDRSMEALVAATNERPTPPA